MHQFQWWCTWYSSLVDFVVWAAFIAFRVLPQMVSSSRATFLVCICTITISGLEAVIVISIGMVDCGVSEALRPWRSAKIMLVTSSCCWILWKILSRTESCCQVYTFHSAMLCSNLKVYDCQCRCVGNTGSNARRFEVTSDGDSLGWEGCRSLLFRRKES